MCVCVFADVYLCTACVFICVYVYMYAYVHVCICMYICIRVHVYAYGYMCIYIGRDSSGMQKVERLFLIKIK